MIQGNLNKGDKLIVVSGYYKGLKLFIKDIYLGSNNKWEQFILARQDDGNDFCRETENIIKSICERNNELFLKYFNGKFKYE